ncbi:hypothetical protein [Bradyrhizobium sp. RT11b]|uniref:hypothetical protein n=1 Tax=Bradyrhizobium sp. RT11b TaxID=3156332 RepID=UPI00339415AF
MVGDGVDGIAMRPGRDVGAQLRDPAVEQRPALFAQPLIDDRGEIPEAIHLRDQGAQARAAPDDADDILAAEDVRLADAERAQLGAHRSRDRRIYAHVGHEGVGVGLARFDQFLDMADLSREVADLQRFSRFRRMLALDRADRRRVGRRGDEEDGVLATILRFAEYLDRAAQHHLAHLRAEILEGAPADSVQRQIGPGAERATVAPR